MSDRKSQLEGWAQKYIAACTEEMGEEDTVLLFTLSMIDRDEERRNIPFPKELEENFLFQVIKKRAVAMGMTLTNPTLAFITSFCTSAGDAVMLLTALKFGNTDKKLITMEDFSYTFAMGFPSREKRSELWDDQKTETGQNMVDLVEL